MGEGMPKVKPVSAVEAASGNVPTEELLKWNIDNQKRALETYKKRLQEAQDAQVSNLLSEGTKHNAIRDHQAMIDQVNASIEESERKLAELGSK